jgi:hypothetical protein
MTDFYLSFPTCKKLQEWGCDIAPNHLTFYTDEGEVDGLVSTECMDSVILRYHLLEDICCTHAREFFGEIKNKGVSQIILWETQTTLSFAPSQKEEDTNITARKFSNYFSKEKKTKQKSTFWRTQFLTQRTNSFSYTQLQYSCYCLL